MPWDRRLEPWLDRYPALRAIGQTPLVPVHLFSNELPGVEVWAKMEHLNPGGSLKDRPVLRMLLGALADGRLQPGKIILQLLGQCRHRLRDDRSGPRLSG